MRGIAYPAHFAIMRLMRKLSADDETDRIYIRLTQTMKAEFQAACAPATMADVIREFIADKIATAKPKRKRTSAEKETA